MPGSSSTVGGSVNVKARPFTERLTTLDAWNLSVQRSLGPTLSVTVAYVGNKGTHTLSDGDGNNTNPNEPAITLPAQYSPTGNALHYDPNGGTCYPLGANCTAANVIPASGATSNTTLLRRFTNGTLPACGGPCGWTQDISYYGDDQDTHYNALQASVAKTLTQGFSINANYAYAHALSTGNNFATWDKQAVIGNDSSVRRSAFTAYGLWRLPFGKGQLLGHDVNGIVNGVIGGWTLSPVVQWQSGLPFSISFNECGGLIPSDAPCQLSGSAKSLVFNQQGRPNGPGGVRLFQAIPNVCTNSSFTCPGLDQIGTIRRNSFFGPNLFNSDLSLEKNVALYERVTLQFRVDAFNAFNHINLGNPGDTTLDDPNASNVGVISGGPYPPGTGGSTNPRQLQFTAHIAF